MRIVVSSNIVAAAASLISCSILTALFNYLGVKVGSNMSRITSWDDVISKVSSRLSKWKPKLLSIGGLLSLLKSVLTSIPLYHMSIFKVSIDVLNHLESIRRNLFYGVDGSDRKLAWIGWNMVITSKTNGGEVALKVLYKRLYALEMCKSISVAEKMGHPSLSYSFHRMPRGGVEQKNYDLLCSKVTDLVLPNISDRWCWSLEGSQEFSVKSSRILIDNTILPKAEVPTRWLRVVPIKVNVHAWRVCLDKLPTRVNLSLRGMGIPLIACPLCNSAVESSSHIFFACPLARQVWRKILIWWELEDVAFVSLCGSRSSLNTTRSFKINVHKSKLMGICVSSNVAATAAFLIGCSILTAPFNYLGVKVGSNMSRITSWDDVISKVSSRLSKWKLKLLSIGGLLSLLKSVLTSIPLYHMSIFKVPIGVLNHSESICQNLFYGDDGSDRKLAWIGWNMVLYKRLYALEMCKSISVAKKMGHPSLSHSFHRMPKGGVEQKNYDLLCSKVTHLVLPNISDRWCWSLEGSQEFSVKSSRILIDNTILPKAEVLTRWLRVVPIKVNVYAWMVCLDKLPTRVNLSLRGMDIPSIACPLLSKTLIYLYKQYQACMTKSHGKDVESDLHNQGTWNEVTPVKRDNTHGAGKSSNPMFVLTGIPSNLRAAM
nr:RNA-directed DNA polymerase, eukaryota [Tanacetum cinerariifolium]